MSYQVKFGEDSTAPNLQQIRLYESICENVETHKQR